MSTLKDFNENSIFRTNALKHLQTVDESFAAFTVVEKSSWLWLFCAMTIILAFTTWAFFGRVAIQVSARGITLAANSKFVSIYSSFSGIATSLKVKPGMKVKRGDILATIYNPFVAQDLKDTQQQYVESCKRMQTYITQYKDIFNGQVRKYQQSCQMLSEKKQHLQDRLKTTQFIYSKKQGLYKKRFVTIIDVENAKNDYLAAREALTMLQQALYDQQLQFNQARQELFDQLNRRYTEYLTIKHHLDSIQLKNNHGSFIVSHVDGIVNHINFTLDDFVMAGKPLFTIISGGTSNQLEALIFINHADGKKVRTGMDVYLLPSEFSAYDYGYIHGRVVEVSEYPASKESANVYLANMNLVDEFFSSGVPFMVRVVLLQNKENKNQLSWTSKTPAPNLIKPGTLVSADINIESASPFHFLLKKW